MQRMYIGWKKDDWIEEITRLQKIIDEQETELTELRKEKEYVHKLKSEFEYKVSEAYWAPKHNERGAGRKSLLTDEIIKIIKAHRNAGMTFKQISEALNLSVGAVHKGSQME